MNINRIGINKWLCKYLIYSIELSCEDILHIVVFNQERFSFTLNI